MSHPLYKDITVGVTQSRSWCSTCQEHTLHERHLFSAGWGCLLTVLTAGIFLPIWLLISLFETFASPPRCQKCGEGHPSAIQGIAIAFLLVVVGMVGVTYWMVSDARKNAADTTTQSEPPPIAAVAPSKPPAIPTAAQPTPLTAQPGWQPTLGSIGRIKAWGKSTCLMSDPMYFQEFVAAMEDSIRGGNKPSSSLRLMMEQHKVAVVPNGSQIHVVSTDKTFYQVEILSGSMKGTRGWTTPQLLEPLPESEVPAVVAAIPPVSPTVPDPIAKSEAKAKSDKLHAELDAMEKERNDATHAASLLNVGRNWEKNQRSELALKTYREMVAKYPKSVEAKTAAQRIKALIPERTQ